MLEELNMGCRPLHYQSWIGTFGNNICTYFIRSAKLANYCQPRTFYGKSLCAPVIFAIAVGSRTSAKESIWDVEWLSNTSGSGWGKGSTRVSRCLSPNPPDNLSLLILHTAVLPGNYRLETPISSQHPAFVGSLCLHGSPGFMCHL